MIKNIIGDRAKIFKKVIIIKSWIITILFSNKSSRTAPRLISLFSRANFFDFWKIKLWFPQDFKKSWASIVLGLGWVSLGSKIVTWELLSFWSTLTKIIYLPVLSLHNTGCILHAFSKPVRFVLIALQTISCFFANS